MTPARFPVVWLTGNTGAGKTTLAQEMERHFNEAGDAPHPLARRIIVLDGDDMRATISTEETLSADDRRTHNLRVARLAALFAKKGFLPLVAVIAPFASVRQEIDALCAPRWVHLKRSGLSSPEKPYEPPVSPSLTLNIDMLSIEKASSVLRQFLDETCREKS